MADKNKKMRTCLIKVDVDFKTALKSSSAKQGCTMIELSKVIGNDLGKDYNPKPKKKGFLDMRLF